MSATFALAGPAIINSIVALIVVLGLIACLALARAFVALGSEDKAIRDLQATVKQPGNLQNVRDAVSSSKSQNTIANRVFRDALFTGSFNVETCNLSDYIYLPRYLAGIFVFVGLLGTVSGIAVSATGLNNSSQSLSSSSGTFSPEATDKFQKDIGVLLGGMGGAFNCTFAGLFATLCISAGNSNFLNKSRQREKTMEELARHQLIPLYEADRDQRTSNLDVQETLFTWLTKLHEATIENKNLALTSHLELIASVRSLNSSLVTAIHENNGMVQAERLSENAQNVANVMTKLDGSVELAVVRWQQIVDNTRDLVQTIQTAGNNLGNQMTQSASELTRLNAAADTRAETFQGYVTNAVDQLQRTSEKLENAAASLNSSIQYLPQERAGLQSAAEQVKSAAEEMAASIRSLRSDLADASHNQEVVLTNMSTGVGDTATQLADLLRRFEITLADIAGIVSIRPIHSELEQIRSDLFVQLQRMENLTREADPQKLQPRLTEMQNQLQEQIGRVEKGLQARSTTRPTTTHTESRASESRKDQRTASRASSQDSSGNPEVRQPQQPVHNSVLRTEITPGTREASQETQHSYNSENETADISEAPENKLTQRSIWQTISQLWTKNR